MNKEYKKEWVDALRSGKYKQGYSRLHTREDNSFCCLGVLCEVTNLKSQYFVSLDYKLMDKVGLIEDEEDWLIMLNDTKRYTFNEIADLIQEKL